MSDTPQSEDRGRSPVADERRPYLTRRQRTWGIIGLCGAAFAYLAYAGWNPAPEKLKEKLPAELGSVEPYVPTEFALPPKREEPRPPPAMPPQPHVQPAAASLPIPQPQQMPLARVESHMATATKKEPGLDMVSYDDPAVKPKAAASDSDPASGTGTPGVPHISYAMSKVSGIKAGLTGDQTLLLMPGVMPCVLDTAINSDLPGPVQCHLAQDIRPHGVTLLDRGSTIYGFYKADVHNGQSRLAVAADWINDPVTGCYVSFDNAPMADQQGRSGLDGHVDNHYFERFGAAVILSLTDAGLGILQSSLSKGGNTYLSFNSGGEMSSVASQILRKQIDIPPTITKNAGEMIAVFVNRPLNFNGCYELRDRK